MHISGAGFGGLTPQPVSLPGQAKELIPASDLLPLPASPVTDSVTTLLQQLTSPPVAHLISGIENSREFADSAVVTSLIHAAVQEVHQGNVPAAMLALTELVRRSPEHVETLGTEPALLPVRAEVQELLTHVIAAAKLEAEVRLSAATQALEMPRAHASRPVEWNPKEVLAVAGQLIDSGRHQNMLLSADLSQAVINYYGAVEIAPPRDALPPRKQSSGAGASVLGQAPWTDALRIASHGVSAATKKLWRASPLLLLLFLWVLLAMFSAFAAAMELWSVEFSLEVWGAGSAGLLGFGTYQRLRG